MTLTLLIDLDDTLLNNDINAFQKVYFKRLSEAILPWASPETMMAAMKAAIKGMLEKKTPALTLEEQFDLVFYPTVGTSKSELAEAIRLFYAETFPQLQFLTAPKPDAVALIETAFQRGWDVVIATNPVFPRSAVIQRLEWAQLPPSRYPFKLITSFETAHFCKPHPAYYAEILGRLNWPQNPVVMIGNSLEDDIQPVETVGLPTFLLREKETVQWRGSWSQTGPMAAILPWLEKIEADQPRSDFASAGAILATLQATPAIFAEIARGLTGGAWIHRPDEFEWNLIEILAHLRDVDREVNLVRILTTIRGDNPFLAGANTDPWVQERKYTTEEGTAALAGFTESRTQLLALIDGANDETLRQPARHAIFGPTSLKELLGFIATHDRTHIRQAYNAIV
ncbi:MAG: DinB family protein [Bellilinea sp.]